MSLKVLSAVHPSKDFLTFGRSSDVFNKAKKTKKWKQICSGIYCPGNGYALTTFVALLAIMGVLTLPPMLLAVTASMSAADQRKTALPIGLRQVLLSWRVGQIDHLEGVFL